MGNISTCVEQTTTRNLESLRLKKHLHMRGANLDRIDRYVVDQETSPHAWSKHGDDPISCEFSGNISTCVEQTMVRTSVFLSERKHLHMRGANTFGNPIIIKVKETSPHAWSKPIPITTSGVSPRNISTCVEQTDLQ